MSYFENRAIERHQRKMAKINQPKKQGFPYWILVVLFPVLLGIIGAVIVGLVAVSPLLFPYLFFDRSRKYRENLARISAGIKTKEEKEKSNPLFSLKTMMEQNKQSFNASN
jgi:hypothetical protein